MQDAKPIQHASTVVIARDGPSGPELFAVQRTAKLAFMANMIVYPGGRLDDEDTEPASIARIYGEASQALAQLTDSPEIDANLAAGLFIAAVRECFEEVGALLVCDADGNTVRALSAVKRERLAQQRTALNAGETSFLQILGEHDLWIDVRTMRYFAHWITPPFESRRYDTRFFIAPCPEGQELVHDNSETVASVWATPSELLDRHAAGKAQLAPPTFRTLVDMANFRSLESLLAWARSQRPVPILPKLMDHLGDMAIVLPGDPDHPSDTPAEPPFRIVLNDGKWRLA